MVALRRAWRPKVLQEYNTFKTGLRSSGTNPESKCVGFGQTDK